MEEQYQILYKLVIIFVPLLSVLAILGVWLNARWGFDRYCDNCQYSLTNGKCRKNAIGLDKTRDRLIVEYGNRNSNYNNRCKHFRLGCCDEY